MTTVSGALTLIGIVLGLLLSAATVVAYFRANYAKATIDTLRDSNDALSKRVTELEAEVSRQTIRADGFEREAAQLRTYVSGTEAVRELEAKVDSYHGTLLEHRRVLTARLAGIEALLRGGPVAL